MRSLEKRLARLEKAVPPKQSMIIIDMDGKALVDGELVDGDEWLRNNPPEYEGQLSAVDFRPPKK